MNVVFSPAFLSFFVSAASDDFHPVVRANAAGDRSRRVVRSSSLKWTKTTESQVLAEKLKTRREGS